jgi:hypothetical protein
MGASAVERLLFGTADPDVIAGVISDFCFDNLGSQPGEALFYRSSVGSVVGLRLENGQLMVLKVFQTRWEASFLVAVQAVQKTLAVQGFPCPEPVLSPTPLSGAATALVTAETVLADPGMRPLSGAQDRAASAQGLATQIACCPPGRFPALASHPLATTADRLYPQPHSPLFDFQATAAGAEWIDRFALRAKNSRDADRSSPVAAHMDWSARNLRIHHNQVVAVYDWDSVALATESAAVGQAAITWSVTSEPGGSTFPDVEEVAKFVCDYEQATGRKLSSLQWKAAGASAAWLLAYTARCEHALKTAGIGRPDQSGATRRLRADGEQLLALSPLDAPA